MKSRLGRGVVWVLLTLAPALSCWHLARSWHGGRDDIRRLVDGYVTGDLLALATSLVCIVAWLALHVSLIRDCLAIRGDDGRDAGEAHPTATIAGLLFGASFLGLSGAQKNVEPNSEPRVETVAALSLGVMATRLVRRRLSHGDNGHSASVLVVEPDSAESPQFCRVIVRVFGHPYAEDGAGRRVNFRKARALELLTWLALNRDRPLRSAARTAIWDSDISDSSFATVVSEMRRGLATLCPDLSSHHWSPPTYGDEIRLAREVCTDFDLLREALELFRLEPTTGAARLREVIVQIRDLPFSGSNYRWPDVDGTTTQLVLSAVNAIDELVGWSMTVGSTREMIDVVAAGLRMLPGNEHLLELQQHVSGLTMPEVNRRMSAHL